jgi:hypothetical protein
MAAVIARLVEAMVMGPMEVIAEVGATTVIEVVAMMVMVGLVKAMVGVASIEVEAVAMVEPQ